MEQGKKRNLFALGIFLLMFTGSICTTTQGVMLTNFIDYYKLESFQQGLMSAFQSGGNFIALFLIGFLLGKMTKGKVLIITAISVPTIFLVFGMRPSFAMLLLGYGLYGVAFGFLDSLGSSLMVDLFYDRSNLYVNLFHGIYGLGGLAGPVILKMLTNRGFEWNELLFFAGILALIASVIYISGTISARNLLKAPSGEDMRIKLGDIALFLKERKTQLLFACAFLYGAHQIGITVWMTRYISEYLNEPGLGALTLSAFWVCVAVARFVFPRITSDTLKIIMYGHLISGLAILAGVCIGNGTIMFICVGVAGLAEGMVLPSTLDMACHWAGEKTAIGSNTVFLAHYVGFIITPMIMGGVIASASIIWGMLIPAFLSIIAAFLMYLIGKQVKS